MAKISPKSSGNSKIRFIMLEADLADGDLSQITAAISQAMRQPQLPLRQLSVQTASTGAPLNEPDTSSPERDEAEENLTAGPMTNGSEPPSTKGRSPRRMSSPKVLSDVDLNSGDVPFEKLANEKRPTAALSRYLLVAYWFKTYRQLEAINSNHVYTCYKKMGWGTDIKDFAQPLRDNARQGRGEMRQGAFAINHIGEDFVEKMTPE